MDFALVGRVMVLNLLPTLKINRVAMIYKPLGCLKFKHIMFCSDFYSLHCMCSAEKVSSNTQRWAGWREDIVCKKMFIFTLAPAVRATQVGEPEHFSTAPALPRLTWQCWVSPCLASDAWGHRAGGWKEQQDHAAACPHGGMKRYLSVQGNSHTSPYTEVASCACCATQGSTGTGEQSHDNRNNNKLIVLLFSDP